MNENVDIALMAANCATRDNPWAHLATRALSMGYNASMLWYYNYQLAMAQSMGPGYIPAEQIRAMKQDRIKHTLVLGLECAVLIAAGVVALNESKKG